MIETMFMGGSIPQVTWTFVDSATSTATTITIPAGAQEGDVAILADFKGASGGSYVTPSGWTAINTVDISQSGSFFRGCRLSYRILPASPGGTSVTGGLDTTHFHKIMIVMRPSSAVTTVSALSVNSEGTLTDPAPQVVGASAGARVFVVAVYSSEGTVNPRTFTPAADGEVTNTSSRYLKYKIFNVSPSDVTVDMDDEGITNTLQSFYVEAI